MYCKECDDARHRVYRKNHPNSSKNKHLLARFNMTTSDRDAMVAEQGGKCAVCKSSDPGPRGWQIDHDHKCCPDRKTCGNCVRGAICVWCNRGLGDFEDNPAYMMNAAIYLSKGSVS
jgi:hypothetical protein